MRTNQEKPAEPDFSFTRPGKAAPAPDYLHGSARWLTRAEAQQAGLYDKGGVLLAKSISGETLYFNGDGHLLVFAPSGAGKGIGFVQPNLLDFRGSMIVLDPKGENAETTAKHRQDMGQRVHVLDPLNKTGFATTSYNPLNLLKLGGQRGNLMLQLRALTEALVPPREKDEAHWINGARLFVHGLLLFLLICRPRSERHLVKLHELAFADSETQAGIFKTLQGIEQLARDTGKQIDPQLARICQSYGNWWFGRNEKELSYFLSMAHQELQWLSDTHWEAVLAGGELIQPKSAPTTVYLVLPWDAVRPYRNWLRVMVHCLMVEVANERGRSEHGDVLFLLDEAYVGLGRLEVLLDAVAILRSAGAKLALVYQDLPQLQSLFKDEWQSFFANAGATAFWAINDMVTAGYVSERLGPETVDVEGSITGEGKPLRRSDQLIAELPADQMICFLRGRRPGKFLRLNVLTDAAFEGLLAPNPDHQPVESEPVWETSEEDYIPVDLKADQTTSPVTSRATLNEDDIANRCVILSELHGVAVEYQPEQFFYWDEAGNPVPIYEAN